MPNLECSISYTTRKPRGSEQNGREYNFVPRATFDEMVGRNEFLEHAEVFGNCYGTAKKFLADAQRANRDLVLDIDVQGAAQIEKKLPDAVSIFILPPDRQTLERRLRSRGEDSDEVIDRRLATAKREIENYDKYDYILVNDRLEESVDALKAIVLGERSQRSGSPLSAEDSRDTNSAERCRLENMREQVRRILLSFEDGTSGTASGV